MFKEGSSNFGYIDYAVFISTLGVSVLIGIYYRFTGGKQKTTEEYLLADRSQHILPVAFSLMASFMSAITLLGVSAENYMFGIQFVVINFGYLIFTPVAAYLYLPVFYQLQATSAYEYLEIRFGWPARIVTSACYTLQIVLYMGIVLYAPALVLKSITSLSEFASILIVGIVCTFYSTLGGMKAVIIADLFQSIVMFCALFSIIFVESSRTNGLSEIWKVAEDHGRTDLLNFSLDPTERHTWFSLIIGGGFTFLSLYAVNQTQVQRYLTMKDLKTAQRSLWLQWPILTVLSLTTSFTGLAIFSRYADCDPIKSGIIKTSDELMPQYVKDTMSELPGAGGLFVAGILSASLTTVSSCLNSLAAITVEDYVKPLYVILKRKTISTSGCLLLTKLLTLAYGVLCITIAFITRNATGILQASLSIFGAVGGPVLGIFTLGMFFPIANQKGAVSGILCGLVASFTLAFGGQKPRPKTLSLSTKLCNTTSSGSTVDPTEPSSDSTEFFYLFRISYLWYIIVGFLITIIIGLIISVITKAPKDLDEEIEPTLFVPFVAKMRRNRQQKVLNQRTPEKIIKCDQMCSTYL